MWLTVTTAPATAFVVPQWGLRPSGPLLVSDLDQTHGPPERIPTRDLPAGPEAAPIARSAVRRQLDVRGVDEETAYTIQLIVSELVGEQFAVRERRLEITFREHDADACARPASRGNGRLLPGLGVEGRCGLRDGTGIPNCAADASGLELLDPYRPRSHPCGSRLRPGNVPRRPRPRKGPCPADRPGCRGQRDLPPRLRQRHPGTGRRPSSEWCQLRLVRDVQRPGRKWLAASGGPRATARTMTAAQNRAEYATAVAGVRPRAAGPARRPLT